MEQLSDNIVVKFNEVLNVLSETRDNDVIKKWLKTVQGHIRLLNKGLKACETIGTKRKLHTNIGHLNRVRTLLKLKTIHLGQGLNRKVNRSDRVRWEDIASAFEGRIRSGIIINIRHKDILQFLNDAYFLFKSRVSNILKSYPRVKVNAVLCGEFIRQNIVDDIKEFKYMNTKNVVIDADTDLETWFRENIQSKILNKLEEFQEKDSGWALDRIINLEVNINRFEFGAGGSSYIKLPKQILHKKACINVKNFDDACFAWAIVSALYPVDMKNHPDRTSSYPNYLDVLNLKGIDFPVTLPQVSKFEKNNNISVNVFGLEIDSKSNFTVVPARLTKQKREKHVNLLIIQNKYFPQKQDFQREEEGDEEIKYHYCYIKNLSRLLNTQVSKKDHKKFFCDRCLNYFSSEDRLTEHVKDCEKLNDCKIEFSKDLHIKFKNFVYKEKVPFIIYADFESLLEPLNNEDPASEPVTKSARYQKHTAYSAGYYFKSNYNNDWSFYKSYRGLDCMSWFANQMEEVAKFVSSKLKHVEPMNVEVSLKDATTSCHICGEKFKENDKICRDHCHLSGNFRGFAHLSCNLNYKNAFAVPVVFHNLGGYDAHFIIRDLAERNHVTLLPVNKEKYISFTVFDNASTIKFRFIDSIRFMGFPLDELASSLDKDDFQNLKNEFPDLDDEKFELLTRKGVFFYDYLDKIERLDETRLPEKEHFYNKLYDKDVLDSDYQHAKLIWNTFDIKTLGDYSDLYMKTDIMLLTCVFETFRNTCHQTYGLDPAHYYTIPGYTWDCMLKYTGCKLETIQDVDVLMFIERGIRGGISQCCNRFSEANNKYLDNFDNTKPSTHILYLDVNNLYGWAMSQPLPYGGFRWIDSNIDVTSIPDDADEGYILEVDIEYPETLHDLHQYLPFCAEHKAPPQSKFKKLMTTLYNKENYVIHYRTLKQAVQHGLRVTRIHKVLKFKQAAWLKSYIDLNTSLRAQAKSDFEKTNFKLMNNAVFGKSMQNVRKHRIVKLVSKWEGRWGARNLIASPQFDSRAIFSENLMAIELRKNRIKFDKPLYIGMSILDISKTCLYEFHYDFMLNKFNTDTCKLLYTDTDSLIYELKCDDVYEQVIKQNLGRFDTSDYPPNNRYNISLVNKKVPGLMKDENKGKIMTHFIGLRSKQYTYKVVGKEDVKKAKGVKSNVVKNKISFGDYLKCLQNLSNKNDPGQCLLQATQRCIQSKLHNVFSVEQSKIALNPFDDKRHLQPNSYDTLPWGHYSIMDAEDVSL